jgi:glucosamine--fructose-6-phosphate aminotransferase (isomerizing)
MNKILAEIQEIPVRALAILNTPVPSLPLQVPYLGMGSSYFAPLAFKYMGVPIQPEIASEYYHYLSSKKQPLGVILSQSGKSSEALWCTQLFNEYVAVTNYPENALAHQTNVSQVIDIKAGEEHYSSSKTYVNTLIALFKGFGYDPSSVVHSLIERIIDYEAKGKALAEKVFEVLSASNIHGVYITGNGPNVATAMEAGLILSESTKRSFQGLSMAQYDHGPKETATNSLVIQIMTQGKSYERALKLNDTIQAFGAEIMTVEAEGIEEHFSILHHIVIFNFMAFYLSDLLGIKEMFAVGGKVTEVV